MDLSLEEYILKYKGYAKVLSKYYYKLFENWNFEFDDLYQAGCLGMIERYHKYNSSKSSFSTYAYLSAKFGIINYIKSNTTITTMPKDLVILISNFTKKKNEYYKKYGKNMSIDEMLDCIKNNCYTGSYKIDEKFIKLLLQIECYHLEDRKYYLEDRIDEHSTFDLYKYKETDYMYVKDFISSSDNTEETAIFNYEIEKIISYLENNFTEINIDIFKETLGLNDGIAKTRRELAEKYNIRFQAIDQRYNKTLKKIKENFNI